MSEQGESRTVEQVGLFFQSHGRWPSAVASSDYEQSLGIWLAEQRGQAAAGVLDHFRRRYLDQLIPGWMVHQDESWMESARALADHILFKRSSPRTDADDSCERNIARWLVTQVSLSRMGKLRPERRAWLDSHCPHWLTPSPSLFGKLAPQTAHRGATGETAG